MSHHPNLKILAFVGLTGSGKSTAVEHFTSIGYPKIYGGGIIYEEMKKAGIEQGEANEKAFRIAIREKEGANFAMERVNKQVHELAAAGQHRVVIDGIYTWEEYKLAKHEFPGELKVVAIVAPKQKRYHWLETRETRPQTIQESSDRDHNEIEDIQKGGPIAAADFYVINDGSIDKLNDRLDEIAAEIQF